MKIYKFIAFFAILMFSVSAYAADTAHIGDYKYWSVYRTAEGVKYMVSYPIADEGNFAKRERPYFMITNFNGTLEVSAYVGYYYKKDSEPKITVYLSNKDPKKVENFAFYTKNDNCTNKIHANWIFLSFFFLQSAVDQKDLIFAPELSF